MTLNRRHFFQTSAAAAATAALLPDQVDAALAGDLKLGVASYSLRTLPLPKAIDAMKVLKVKYLKLKLEVHLPYNSPPDKVAEAKKMIADAGLILESTGNTSLQKPDEGDIRAKFEFNKNLGVKTMIIAPTMESLPIIEKMCKEFDMKVAIHNHGPEDKHFPAPMDVLKAVKGMDPRVGLCIDIGHASRAGANLLADVKAARARLYDLDGKDLADPKVASSQCDVGDGVLPIAGIFKELIEQKYAEVYHLEYEINAKDPVPGMQRSFFYMRGVLAGLKA
jgi:sugar phosphate isomerase/epimerase